MTGTLYKSRDPLLFIYLLPMSSAFYKTLRSNLETRFYRSEKFAGRLALAVLSKTPIVFYGRGGLGKTEMIQIALKTMGLPYRVFECHPETTVSDLFGGAVARAESETIQEEGNLFGTEITRAAIDYDNGFLNYPAVFLEEMADMPPRAVAALKSVLTSGEWDNRPSKNIVTIGATNTSLTELEASMTPDYLRSWQAFATRFIQVEHSWDSFNSSAYYGVLESYERAQSAPPIQVCSPEDLLEEMRLVKTVKIPASIKHTLAEIFAKVTAEGRVFLGGRDIIYAMHLARTYAYMSGCTEVDLDHLSVIELFGAAEQLDELEEIVAETKRSETARSAITKIEADRVKVLSHYGKAGIEKYLQALTVKKNLELLVEQVLKVVTTDSTHTSLENLKTRLEKDIKEAKSKIDAAASTEVLV